MFGKSFLFLCYKLNKGVSIEIWYASFSVIFYDFDIYVNDIF
jgi:hypothetical protein